MDDDEQGDFIEDTTAVVDPNLHFELQKIASGRAGEFADPESPHTSSRHRVGYFWVIPGRDGQPELISYLKPFADTAPAADGTLRLPLSKDSFEEAWAAMIGPDQYLTPHQRQSYEGFNARSWPRGCVWFDPRQLAWTITIAASVASDDAGTLEAIRQRFVIAPDEVSVVAARDFESEGEASVADDWSKRLNECFNLNKAKGDRRNVRLPSQAGLHFSGAGGRVELHLNEDAVSGNMQTNSAAFDSWALALHHWCGVQVQISWSAPDFSAGDRKAENAKRHYERFLYRLANFRDLFGNDWLTVVDPDGALDRRETRPGAQLYVNQGGDKPKTIKPREGLAHELWSEDQWECHLADPAVRWLDNKFGPFASKTQQFPVGLFSKPTPSDRTRVFPGAKSAIDIAAVAADTLWIFELKKSGNIGFGALSELMFYCCFMRDVVDGRFELTGLKSNSRVTITAQDLAPIKRINGVLMAPKVHPLIEGDLLALVNSALARAPGRRIEYLTHEFDPTNWSRATLS